MKGQMGIRNLETEGDGVRRNWSKGGKTLIRHLLELSENTVVRYWDILQKHN